DVRRYVRQVLRPEYEVIEAADGEEGAEKAREELPDVILADVMMPSVDGHEMTRRLKGDPETEAIPVIMVTARAETSDEVEGLQVGADDYVTKPFDANVLQQRIQGVVAMQERLRRRLREQLRGEEPPGTTPEPDTAEQSDFEREAREAIRQHLSDPTFDVDALAEALHVSRSTLYRRFREHTDTSPADLITRLRIEQAADLLRQGEGTATQVAYAVGFERLADFSDQFEAIMGVRPSQYAG
ncbi:MAG: response regulator, partial [Salinibacter sp.]